MNDRSKFLGGSDVAAVLGLSPWKTPVQLWLQKTGQVEYEEVDPARQRRFDRGHKLEPFIIEMGIDKLREQGHDVELIARNQRYIDQDYPFLACEIDAEIMVDGEPANVDAKSVHGFARNAWGDEDTDEIPIYYAAQFAFGMGITGRKRCYTFALIGLDDVAIYPLDHDADTIADIRWRCIEFWEKCVIGGERPEVLSYDDAGILWPKDDGTSVEATDDIAEAVADYDRLTYQRKQLDDLIDQRKIEIVEFMQPHATLTRAGKPIATWKSQTASRLDQKGLRAAHPSICADFTNITESRVFRIKRAKV